MRTLTRRGTSRCLARLMRASQRINMERQILHLPVISSVNKTKNHVGSSSQNFHTKVEAIWDDVRLISKQTWSTTDGLTMTGKLAVEIDEFLKREMTRFR